MFHAAAAVIRWTIVAGHLNTCSWVRLACLKNAATFATSAMLAVHKHISTVVLGCPVGQVGPLLQ